MGWGDFIDVVSGVTEETAKDDEDVVDVMFQENWIRDFFDLKLLFPRSNVSRKKSEKGNSDVSVIPGIVVD